MSQTTDPVSYDWLPEGFQVREIQTNGVTISCAWGGSGAPMVLLHGWPQTGRIWRHVMPELAENYTVVVPDLRGSGASERPADGYQKTNQARDMRGVLAALGLTGPAVVVGHDIGAMVASAWAAKYPEDVAALVLLDCPLLGEGLRGLMDVTSGGMWHFGFFAAPEIPEMLFDGHELEFFRWAFPAMAGKPDAFSDDEVALYARAYTGRDRLRGGFGHYRTLLEDCDEVGKLLENPLEMPVLAVGGVHWENRFGDEMEPYVKRLTKIVAPSGHFVAEEVPGWFLENIARFLAAETANSHQ
ncbi:alpha/beta fold hydrolase [Amycolatopsis pithecellobii]|uniref:Alpha/beta fold hydrolase n=1 Tax=Amycolatopsis pithecellobii TaxID=664692 RepID=A0A6N7Z523_9PSEU|nr:alpha/beta hydrolase [Amycolatopsis pithecellobii]MTD54456.1 alpha/beta fold hydrolase [Amycolatopsis pithecellobii]